MIRKPRRPRGSIHRIAHLLVLLISLTLFCLIFFASAVSKLDHPKDAAINLNFFFSKSQFLTTTTTSARDETETDWLPPTAFLEDPLDDTAYPLPLRTPRKPLKKITYESNGCHNFHNFLPTVHGRDLDAQFGPNVGQLSSLYPQRYVYASACPVDADPFLPFLHDVFFQQDGNRRRGGRVVFVAHNKRRCRTDPKTFQQDLRSLEPQLALLQSVPVQTLSEDEARRWIPPSMRQNRTHPAALRYKLAPSWDAPNVTETRFLCRFHQQGTRGVVGETLSRFPYNFEHDNFRKPGKHAMLTFDPNDKHGAHNENVWNAMYSFHCPLPSSVSFPSSQKLYVDLVPIRTRPRRTRAGYFPQLPNADFNPMKEWGEGHVLPTVEQSGRWANIPVCPLRPPRKQHFLVGCLWASAVFTTRGSSLPDTSTKMRLLEWLTYHLYIAGFDHIYIYDNTEAHTNATSLEPVISLFPPDRVTRVPWKHRVCNNNRPTHRNAGERSSQYAAETSCRLRYGPSTEWMASFDTDEYFIPQATWSNLPTWLRQISPQTHILSFFQTRAKPNLAFLEPHFGGAHANTCGRTLEESECLVKRQNVTYLQAYDCESTPLPKPGWAWRAKKQIYRPAFVLNHFVHYSLVTRRILEAPHERSRSFVQPHPYERRVEEVTEAFLLHTKTTPATATAGWSARCRKDDENNCPVGIAWPEEGRTASNVSKEGLRFNCYQHDHIQKNLVARLEELVEPLLSKYHSMEGK